MAIILGVAFADAQIDGGFYEVTSHGKHPHHMISQLTASYQVVLLNSSRCLEVCQATNSLLLKSQGILNKHLIKC